MPTDSAEQVAADHSATVETPAEGVEAADEAESVEVSPPQPVDSVAKTSQSWADLSEVQDSPVPSGVDSATVSAHPQGSLVKEEIHEAETISAVIATTGLPEEVADEPAATEETEQGQTLDQDFLEEQPHTDNPAEAAFTDLDRAKEEQDLEEHPPSSPSEQVEHKVETTDLLGLGDEAGPVGEASVASEPSASVPEALVADASGVATEATVTDSSELVPPPTSPNLVDPGAEPIQLGLVQWYSCHHCLGCDLLTGQFSGARSCEIYLSLARL